MVLNQHINSTRPFILYKHIISIEWCLTFHFTCNYGFSLHFWGWFFQHTFILKCRLIPSFVDFWTYVVLAVVYVLALVKIMWTGNWWVIKIITAHQISSIAAQWLHWRSELEFIHNRSTFGWKNISVLSDCILKNFGPVNSGSMILDQHSLQEILDGWGYFWILWEN